MSVIEENSAKNSPRESKFEATGGLDFDKPKKCTDDSCFENSGTSELFKKDGMFIPEMNEVKRKIKRR